MAVLMLVGATLLTTLTTANATVDLQASASAGDVSVLADPTSCRSDVLQIRYDPLGIGSFETNCFANAGWVRGGATFPDTILMCSGNNDVDYDIGNIRTTLWRWDCRTIYDGTDISRVYIH